MVKDIESELIFNIERLDLLWVALTTAIFLVSLNFT